MKLSAPVFQLKRQAKERARKQGIPLHASLDDIARQEGFATWSLLASKSDQLATASPAEALYAKLQPGDMVLLGARPGHGKTMLGLEILVEAARDNHRGSFFTMEFNEQDAEDRLEALVDGPMAGVDEIKVDASDSITADYVVRQLRGVPRGTVAVIDYLQIMDQRRVDPSLSVQVSALRGFSKQSGVIFVFISQIDRAYELSEKPVPDTTDVRLPNPLDLSLFDKACFLNHGEARIDVLH